ncbi:phBC6A51 family helix-turn-helix protein [Rummeliibacillus suwonensis]|uniref:phBC6A51 family helix-turn-helix protein n=1 Tax=Rummeliibacillus suwonensis TaxID=1306154 RepID=UPI001AAEF7C9|nr:phBC6A51 family helix-turn-helix protein [Rummeliibacillus suwonensis]MBO2536293.1 hypothetical protein [Rummeliibacillus suwonensis]
MDNKQDDKMELVEAYLDDSLELDSLPKSRYRSTSNLTPLQQRICVLVSTKSWSGMSYKKMAELLKCSEQQIYKTIRKPESKLYIEEMLDAKNREFLGTVYAELQDIIIHSNSVKAKLEAIKIYLQVTGKNAPIRVEMNKYDDEPRLSQKDREIRLKELEKELFEDENDHIYRPEK